MAAPGPGLVPPPPTGAGYSEARTWLQPFCSTTPSSFGLVLWLIRLMNMQAICRGSVEASCLNRPDQPEQRKEGGDNGSGGEAEEARTPVRDRCASGGGWALRREAGLYRRGGLGPSLERWKQEG